MSWRSKPVERSHWIRRRLTIFEPSEGFAKGFTMTSLQHKTDHRGSTEIEGGLAVLGPEPLAVRAELDRIFASWGANAGAVEIAYPSLLRIEDLAKIDYWANFPHLALLVAGARDDRVGELTTVGNVAIDSDLLSSAEYALPSAACYAVYLNLRGQNLATACKVTTVSTCFRRESHYDGLRRLLSFTMREIVCVGDRETVLDHVASCKARAAEFAQRLDLPLSIETATDPFFDPSASRSLVQKLFPVKEEFVFRGEPDKKGLAIASANFHRNFFGERCDIKLSDGTVAFSSCFAFGLERWLAALHERFGPSWPEILAHVRNTEKP
jgi:seryl-tRNA synthetase